MTPFCSLKQNCNTLLVQFCYSKQLKAVKKKMALGSSRNPHGKPSRAVWANTQAWDQGTNMDSSVYLHLTFSHQSIKLTSFVLPLWALCEPHPHPFRRPLGCSPLFLHLCVLQSPSVHKVLLVTLTIQSPLPWHHCWQNLEPHISSHHSLKPEQQWVEWLPGSFPNPSGWRPWVRAQFSSVPNDLFLSRHHRLDCMGSVHLTNSGNQTH